MVVRSRHCLLLLAALSGGCVWNRQAAPVVRHPLAVGWEGKANLNLEDISPPPKLMQPTTQPAARAPVEALALYAQSRDATIRGQYSAAIDALTKAIAIDPNRFQLRYDLGWAYVNANVTDDSAITAFEKAALLEPDNLALQTELGRLYLSRSNQVTAIEKLRLATQTTDYTNDDGQAAVADFFLARALKDAGYDRAALNQYTILVQRFEHPSLSLQENPELGYMLERPDSLFVQIGELLERHAEYADALKAFGPAIDREPDNFELQSRYARDLALDGQRDLALKKATDLIVRDRATPATLGVLHEVCDSLNIVDGEVDTLRTLSANRPEDHAVLFALTDTLTAKSRPSEARQILESAWQKSSGDISLTRRLFALDQHDNRVESAARLLIHAMAVNPDAVQNDSPLWNELLRAGQTNRMKLAAISGMQVPIGDEGARQYCIALTAANDGRLAVQRRALHAATRATPLFAPAFRLLIDLDWHRTDWSDAQRIDGSNRLIDLAKTGGDIPLSLELTGRSLAYQKQKLQAMEAFVHAIDAGGRSPDLQLAFADTVRMPGRDPTYEENLWKLINDSPLFDGGYKHLFDYYSDPNTGTAEQASKVLATWLVNDPQCVTARILQVDVDLRQGQVHDAEQELSRLFGEDPNDPGIFRMMQKFYGQTGRMDELIGKLEDEHTKHPRDTDLVARLVKLYADQKRDAEAVRLLDSTRLAVADDADLLYSLNACYRSLNQKETMEDLLQQVVQLDPTHALACNYLGFIWADAGKNLPRAEALIRTAVAAEPDNQSFLDSLGWVLYKSGNFGEAQKYLQQAIGPSALPDPLILDHLGDALYRLSKTDEAKQTWQQSLKGLDVAPKQDDTRQLRLQLLGKIRQVDEGKPVAVAPTTSRAQAYSP